MFHFRIIITFILLFGLTGAHATPPQTEEPLAFIAAKSLYPDFADDQLLVWDANDHNFQIFFKENTKFHLYQAELGPATLNDMLIEMEIDPETPLSRTTAQILDEKIQSLLSPIPESFSQKLASKKGIAAAFGDENSPFALVAQAIEQTPNPVDTILSIRDFQHLVDSYLTDPSTIPRQVFLCALQLLHAMEHLDLQIVYFRSTTNAFPIDPSYTEWPDAIAPLYFLPGTGFTVSAVTGFVPATGFVVALPGHSYMIDATRFFAGSPSQEFAHKLIREYIRKHADILAQPHIYLGGWHDPDSNIFFLDLSEIFNDLQEAIQAGIERDQIAIYDLSTGMTIPTGGTGGLPNVSGF